MQKRGCLLLIIFILLLTTTTAYATEAVHYDIEELGMDVLIPSDLAVFTQHTPADDPNLALLASNRANLLERLAGMGIFLNAISPHNSYEIVVRQEPVDGPAGIADLKAASRQDADSFAQAVRARLASDGVACSSGQFYENENGRFVKVATERPYKGRTAHGLQYYTVKNAIAVSVSLHSYSGVISQEKEALLLQIVDSVRFAPTARHRVSAALAEAAASAIPGPAAELSGDAFMKKMVGLPISASDGDLSRVVLRFLAVTGLLYSLPVALFRLLVRRKPLPAPAARRFSLGYAVCAFAAVMVFFCRTGNLTPSIALIPCTYVNYGLLTGSRRRS